MIVSTKPQIKNSSRVRDFDFLLASHAAYIKSYHLQELFAESSTRSNDFSICTGALTLDFSHQRINDDTLNLLAALADQYALHQKMNDLISGSPVNLTELRPALHTALRDPLDKPLFVDGLDIKPAIRTMLNKMQALCVSFWQRDISDVLVLGIGGSYWGSACAIEALQTLPKRLRVRFLADTEYDAFAAAICDLRPEKTMVIAISKSFTTHETLTNLKRARSWLGPHFNEHSLAVTAAVDKALVWGIKAAHVLEFWPWVGGRYSVWSSVGIPIVLAYGMEVFQALLMGAHQMDLHAHHAPTRSNLPMMAALISFFNTRYLHIPTEAIIPYGFRLSHFIPYVQQLSMESLGKCHDVHGKPIMQASGPIVWGQTGLHAQHAFNQLLHQGTHSVAIDFILPMDQDELVASCLAQSSALAFGDLDHPLVHARTPGNQAHHILKLESLTPYSLGMLMAFYEHKTYLQACLFNINAFDQFGIELAKRITHQTFKT